MNWPIAFGILIVLGACRARGEAYQGSTALGTSQVSIASPQPVDVSSKVAFRFDPKRGELILAGHSGDLYTLTGLWRYVPPPDMYQYRGSMAEAPRGQWSAVPFSLRSTIRLLGADPVPMSKLIGDRLAPGTYFARGQIGERTEMSFLFNSATSCMDIDLGDAPTGAVATCVVEKDHAQSWFVPDPVLIDR